MKRLAIYIAIDEVLPPKVVSLKPFIKTNLIMQWNSWSLRCSWSIAYRRYSNYIFTLDLTPGFNGLGKDNCKMIRETFKFWDLMSLLLQVWRYLLISAAYKRPSCEYSFIITTQIIPWPREIHACRCNEYAAIIDISSIVQYVVIDAHDMLTIDCIMAFFIFSCRYWSTHHPLRSVSYFFVVDNDQSTLKWPFRTYI